MKETINSIDTLPGSWQNVPL